MGEKHLLSNPALQEIGWVKMSRLPLLLLLCLTGYAAGYSMGAESRGNVNSPAELVQSAEALQHADYLVNRQVRDAAKKKDAKTGKKAKKSGKKGKKSAKTKKKGKKSAKKGKKGKKGKKKGKKARKSG